MRRSDIHKGFCNCYIYICVCVCVFFFFFFFFFFAVEMMSALANCGIGLATVYGFMNERLGPRWTVITATVLFTSGYVLMWSSVLSRDFYHQRPYLHYIYFFWAGNLYLALFIIYAQ